MFVRWKRRKPLNRRRSYGGRTVQIVSNKGDSLDAVVVENKRDGRKIRQRVVCHLGVVHENTKHETRDRFLFWKYTVPKLDQLSLDTETRTKLEAQLNDVIPALSKIESDQYEAEATARFNRLMGRDKRPAA